MKINISELHDHLKVIIHFPFSQNCFKTKVTEYVHVYPHAQYSLDLIKGMMVFWRAWYLHLGIYIYFFWYRICSTGIFWY